MRRVSLLLAVLTVAVPSAIVMGGTSLYQEFIATSEAEAGNFLVPVALALVALIVGAVLLFATLFAFLHPPGLPSPPARDAAAPDGAFDIDEGSP